MQKILLISTVFSLMIVSQKDVYPWLGDYDSTKAISAQIPVPKGYIRVPVEEKTFEHWLRNLPLKPKNTPVRNWDGELKWNQDMHTAVVDIDFIGKNLQQCIDVIIRLRAEYLWSIGRADEIEFSYTCCKEKISWSKWKNGWRTKIVKKNNLDTFEWVKSSNYEDTRENFRKYLYNIMMYAGTRSLSENMKKIDACSVKIGDAFIEGAAPGYGHGVLILDMAKSPTGEIIMLLGQSFNPAENFNILVSDSKVSPWFILDFDENLKTPQWTFTEYHARRFQ